MNQVQSSAMPYMTVFGGFRACWHKGCPKNPKHGWCWIAAGRDGDPLPDRCAGCKNTTWNREPEKRGRKPKKGSRARETNYAPVED